MTRDGGAAQRPDPSPEFVARAVDHGQKLFAELRELEAAGWPAGVR